ncbi:MAG TPA: glycoside hydrolase [Bacteroidia bacterium]|nr:glycoside hydrolase [Bacteroidia bacterium]
MKKITLFRYFIVFLFSLFTSVCITAQPYNPSLFNCMKWRMIGPYRGGRTVGACGVIQQPNVYYIGVNDGGVWKTNDYGRTWQPIFDEQATGSIGDVAVAPSNPNVIYVGTGEGVERPDLSIGDGMYKSTDGGKTWTFIGLSDAQQIGGLAIDPNDENKCFAAVLGHPYGPNKERGVFRTTDGGKTWEKVLFIDENTGAIQVTIDPTDSKIVYADLPQIRQGAWENSDLTGPNSGLYKSVDGGTTWKKLSIGLPTAQDGLGRIGFCIAPSNHTRLYATVDSKKGGGEYRSDDGGNTWTLLTSDIRLWDRGDDFAEIKADPKNADIVYDVNVVVWKSVDGGKTWTGFKGAPGGDDYHRLWINPNNTDVMILAGDQGAAVTTNGGETWGSWYNQPTAQLYHVSADNAFPYNVYSGQQESGSVGIASRGNDGEITFRDWHPVSAEEYGYVVADPMDPNIIYGGKISKFDKRTGQVQDISPDATHSGKYRFLRTAPIVFSAVDNKTLYFAGNVVFKTYDRGNSWQVISPDLTRETYDVPASIGVYASDSMKTMRRRGVIYTLSPSPIDSNTIWAGTDDGYMQVTRDGGRTWTNVTPPNVTSWNKISLMDASHTDVNTAYAAVNCIKVDDLHPHIYRTKDGGKTWVEIVNGLPIAPINVVKEDPIRKGLLFAGSERSVYVSFDDGDHWQSLRLNMPATSIRDLVIKDNDLVVATHGRSFWILDDITSLRQITKESVKEKTILYNPEPAYRVRWNMWPDTPLPGDEPAGKNPPDGAIIDYYLATNSKSEVTLDISEHNGAIIRHYSSKDTMYKIPAVNIPLYWVRPQQILSADSGSHRFLWDMRYAPLPVPAEYPISAIVGETAPAPSAPWAMTGFYIVTLTVDGKKYSQTIEVKMDPRVKTSITDLLEQRDLSLACYNDRKITVEWLKEVVSIQSQIKALLPKTTGTLTDALKAFEKDCEAANIGGIDQKLKTLFDAIQGVDTKPTSQCEESVKDVTTAFEQLRLKWESLKKEEVLINEQLKEAGLVKIR